MNTSEALNLESLKNILDKYFPERQDSTEVEVGKVLKNLIILNIDAESLVNKIELINLYLPEIEQGEIDRCKADPDYPEFIGKWGKLGAINTVLYFTVPMYPHAGLPPCVDEYLADWKIKNPIRFKQLSKSVSPCVPDPALLGGHSGVTRSP